jgi:hypothetical protein
MPSNPQAKLIRGDRLTDAQRRQVLVAFVYRLTYENQKEHPSAVRQTGGKVQMSDDQWIREHAFRFTKSGRLSGRYAAPVYMAENPAEIHALVRRLPDGSVQFKINPSMSGMFRGLKVKAARVADQIKCRVKHTRRKSSRPLRPYSVLRRVKRARRKR